MQACQGARALHGPLPPTRRRRCWAPRTESPSEASLGAPDCEMRAFPTARPSARPNGVLRVNHARVLAPSHSMGEKRPSRSLLMAFAFASCNFLARSRVQTMDVRGGAASLEAAPPVRLRSVSGAALALSAASPSPSAAPSSPLSLATVAVSSSSSSGAGAMSSGVQPPFAGSCRRKEGCDSFSGLLFRPPATKRGAEAPIDFSARPAASQPCCAPDLGALRKEEDDVENALHALARSSLQGSHEGGRPLDDAGEGSLRADIVGRAHEAAKHDLLPLSKPHSTRTVELLLAHGCHRFREC